MQLTSGNKGGLSVSNSIFTKTFPVEMGSFVKIKVPVIDPIKEVNVQALVGKLIFYNQQGSVINGQYGGASISQRYGNFIYIESVAERNNVSWSKDIVTVPGGAVELKLELFPWKGSVELAIIGNVECVDARCIENSDEDQYILPPGQVRENVYQILPFWRSRFVAEILIKGGSDVVGPEISLSFRDGLGNELEIDSVQCAERIGSVKVLSQLSLAVIPVAAPAFYEGFTKLQLFLHITPPVNAKVIIIKCLNGTKTYPVLWSTWFNAYDFILESRFSSDTGMQIVTEKDFPYRLAKLSLSKLREKRSEDVSVLETELAFYVARGDLSLIEKISNAIVNANIQGTLRYKARHKLSLIAALNTNWLPDAGYVDSTHTSVSASSRVKKTAYIFPSTVGEHDEASQSFDQWFAELSFSMPQINNIVITALGATGAGDTGEPWEMRSHERFRCYHLNCIAADVWETIPITQQMHFQALLISNILALEKVDLIHVFDGDRGWDLALIALSLSKVYGIPFVYERSHYSRSSVDLKNYANSLTKASDTQELRCMNEAHALIVRSEQHAFQLIRQGIDGEKIFQLSESGDATDSGTIWLNKVNADVYEQAYQYACASNFSLKVLPNNKKIY